MSPPQRVVTDEPFVFASGVTATAPPHVLRAERDRGWARYERRLGTARRITGTWS